MARILVLGGHGRIALLTLPLLVRAGHETAGVIRNPAHADEVAATGAVPRVADLEALDQQGTDELLAGADVVVWSAGAGGGDPRRTKAVDHDAALRVLDAVERTGSRLVMVSYFGASLEHGIAPDDDFFAYAEAKARVDARIRTSGADWLILAPSTLTNDPEGGITIFSEDDEGASGQIARATVARLIAAVVEQPRLSRRTLRCNDGETPVELELSALR